MLLPQKKAVSTRSAEIRRRRRGDDLLMDKHSLSRESDAAVQKVQYSAVQELERNPYCEILTLAAGS